MGHSETINQILFSGPSNPHVLCSCSSDGTIRAWDTRTFQQVHFVPGKEGKLISASEDGLICTFDTTGDINDDGIEKL